MDRASDNTYVLTGAEFRQVTPANRIRRLQSNRSKYMLLALKAKRRENFVSHSRLCWLYSHWLRKWREIFIQSQSFPIQSQIKYTR